MNSSLKQKGVEVVWTAVFDGLKARACVKVFLPFF